MTTQTEPQSSWSQTLMLVAGAIVVLAAVYYFII
jgi:hypothetical protein